MKQTIEDRLIWWYIIQKNRVSKGTSLIYDLKTIIQIWAIAEIYIKLILDINLTWAVRGIAGAIMLIGFWFIGLIWDKRGYFLIENEWSNQRNKFVKEMRGKIK